MDRRAEAERKTYWAGRSAFVFALSVASLAAASAFAGAALRPFIERSPRPNASSPGELAAFLEHAAADVRLGRGGLLVDALVSLASEVGEPFARERVLALLTEAALQAERLSDAAAAEAQRESLVADPGSRRAIRLRRIGLAVALAKRDEAEALAKPFLEGEDSHLADEARLRLASSMGERELRSWIESSEPRDSEQARRAGTAALRLLGDADAAGALLGPLEKAGQRDESLLEALLEVQGRLGRHDEVARLAEVLLRATRSDDDRKRLGLLRANALSKMGDLDAALAALEPLRRSQQVQARRAARRARYEILQGAGRLVAAVAALRDVGERAFVALEVERDYAEAERLFQMASSGNPYSLELAAGLEEAERRRELAERRDLYQKVLEKDPNDQAIREKLRTVMVSLGEGDAVRRMIDESVRGREAAPEALLGAALSLEKAGLQLDAVAYLERAYAAESDAAKRQQLLFALGDIYVETQREGDARRLYAGLAAEGASPEIRERAVARLASVLRL